MKIIDPSSDHRWDEFVHQHPDGTVFHTSNWARVIQRSYGYVPCYVIREDSRGGIKAGLPLFLIGNRITGKRLVSLPFTDQCAPLFSDGDDMMNITNDLAAVVKNMGARSVEIRAGIAGAVHTAAPGYCVFGYYKLYLLDLEQGLDRIWSGFKQKSVRYPIRKAEACALTIRQGGAERDIRIFHKLNVITRKKHGVIPQPYRFFENIYQELIAKKLAFLLIAEYRDRSVAASIFFTYRKTMHYKYNCSSGLYSSCQPNHLLLWHEIDLPYYFYPEIRSTGGTIENGSLYRTATTVLKKIPAAILEQLGTVGYKYFA
jgi:serine/alanine adding enzyme